MDRHRHPVAGRRQNRGAALAAIATGILFPISAIAAFVASAASFDFPGGWSILVPALLPPLIAHWAIWLRSPRLRVLGVLSSGYVDVFSLDGPR